LLFLFFFRLLIIILFLYKKNSFSSILPLLVSLFSAKASRASGYRAKHVGVEDIELKSVYVEGKEASDEDHAWTAISLDNVEDAYVRGIRCRHIGFACVDVRDGSIRTTVDEAESVEPVSLITGGQCH